MSLMRYKPNDRRNFVHKRFIGAVSGFLGGGPGGALKGFIGGGRRRGGAPSSAIRADPCPQPGTQMGTRGCYNPRTQNRDGTPKGGVIPQLHRAGQALVSGGFTGSEGFAVVAAGSRGVYSPMTDVIQVRRCLPGDVLGRDGNCHAKGDISNKNRAHPRGRRPLGTPGEMAALAKAASFGRRMETTVKRMQKIGVLKKPSRSSRRRSQPMRQIGPGPSIINVE